MDDPAEILAPVIEEMRRDRLYFRWIGMAEMGAGTRSSTEDFLLATAHTLAGSWWLLCVPVEDFPVPTDDRPALQSLLHGLHQVLNADLGARKLFLQVWKVRPEAGSEALEEHVGWMKPILGMGIWPDRDPPRSWTTDDLSDASASLFNGEEMKLASHRLLRLDCRAAETQAAAELLWGTGVCLQIYSSAPAETLKEQADAAFVPGIREPRFRRKRFYCPVLDRRGFTAARNEEELEKWMCGAEAYLRESAEDKAVLFATALPQTEVLQAVASAAGLKLQVQCADGTVVRYPIDTRAAVQR